MSSSRSIRSGLEESQFASPMLYPLATILVVVMGGTVLSFSMFTLAQLLPSLTKPVTTKFQVWLVPSAGT